MRKRSIEQLAAPAKPDKPVAEFEPGYIELTQHMISLLGQWMGQGHPAPRFQLPHPTILLAATISQVPAIAKDQAARELCVHFCHLAERLYPDNGPPSVSMLRVALDESRIAYDICGIADLGLRPLGDGSGGYSVS